MNISVSFFFKCFNRKWNDAAFILNIKKFCFIDSEVDLWSILKVELIKDFEVDYNQLKYLFFIDIENIEMKASNWFEKMITLFHIFSSILFLFIHSRLNQKYIILRYGYKSTINFTTVSMHTNIIRNKSNSVFANDDDQTPSPLISFMPTSNHLISKINLI